MMTTAPALILFSSKKGFTQMYTKDKTHRITLRLNDEQFEFVKANAEMLDVSPSDFLRMVINSSLSLQKMAKPKIDALTEKIKASADDMKEGLRRENEQTDCDNIV
jgi:menaquinone-dependent protoporphyrinogen IX oxidase